MKNITIQMFCLFLFSFLHGMEKELLLRKKDSPKIQKNLLGISQCVIANRLPEKVFLLRYVISSQKDVESKAAQDIKNKITYYMVNLVNQDKKIVPVWTTQKEMEMAQKIDVLQRQIRTLTEKINQSPYGIKVNINECAHVVQGAAAGGCCGCLSGAVGNSVAGFVNQYVWVCCGTMIPSNILCDMMAWGLPVCTCVGCLVGGCCAKTRYYEKFNISID